MPKRCLNKIRYPFLEGAFSENPVPYKKLNRKAIKASILSNKRGLNNRIRNIQKNIIEKIATSKIVKKTTFSNIPYTEVSSLKRLLSPKVVAMMYGNKQKEYIKNKYSYTRNHIDPRLQVQSIPYKKPITTKYIFSLDQLKSEFQKKQSQYSKNSIFKNLLLERKKCSLIYGSLGEKQMQKLIEQAKHFDGKFDENFMKILESRLDVTLYRICFFCNIFSAKQWIHHGHVLINKKVVTIPGYQLKAGDVISISADKKNVLKKKMISLIAQKYRIRSLHYFVKINSFYTIVKNLVKYQNKKFFLYEKKNAKQNNNDISTKLLYVQQRIDNIISFTHFEESRKIVVFLKKSFYALKKSIYKNKVYNSLYLLPKMYPFFSLFVSQKITNSPIHLYSESYRCEAYQKYIKLFSIFYPFLKVRNLFTLARPFKQRMKSLKISGMKPLNLEVCYKNMVAIFLYSPQKIALPATIDYNLIGKNCK